MPNSSRQLLLVTGGLLVELDIAVGAERALLDEFALFSHDVFNGDAGVGEDLFGAKSVSFQSRIAVFIPDVQPNEPSCDQQSNACPCSQGS